MSRTVSLRSPHGFIEVTVIPLGSHAGLPVYKRLDGRPFVAGVPGTAYTLLVRNLSGSRIEVIASVDGRNVLKDEPAHPHDCRGLVIAANGQYLFPGWRFNDDETGDFVFGTPAASVAAQAGAPAHIGVIGFAVWTEQYKSSYSGLEKAAVAAGAASYGSPVLRGGTAKSAMEYSIGATRGSESYAASSIGTGIGERRHNPVGRTEFQRSPLTEPDILEIGYDTEEALLERGIIRPLDPQAFPGSPTGYDRYLAAPQS